VDRLSSRASARALPSSPGRGAGTNWAGNVAYRAQRVHRPATVAALQQVVARSSRLRAVGTGHSFNLLADTTGDLVSVAGLPRVVDVDSAGRCVRVSAGLRYGEVVGPLHEAGFALHNLGSLPHISVAGACATGTHGSGVDNGTLASAVSALEMVTADGTVVRRSRAEDGDRFGGCVVALGALGVVTALELDVEPTFDVRQHVYERMPLEVVREHADEVLASGYSVSLFLDWRSRCFDQVWRKTRVDRGDAAAEVPDTWFGARLAQAPRHPVPGMLPSTCTEQLGVPGPWHARLPHFRLEFVPSSGAELQSEWFVRREDAVAALDALEPLRDRIALLVQVAEVRTIAADPLWLSPSAGRDTVALHFTWVQDEAAVVPLAAAVEDRLADLGARPHWAKVSSMAPEVLRARYPRCADFEQLMRDHDPTGTFRNELLDAWFPRT